MTSGTGPQNGQVRGGMGTPKEAEVHLREAPCPRPQASLSHGFFGLGDAFDFCLGSKWRGRYKS